MVARSLLVASNMHTRYALTKELASGTRYEDAVERVIAALAQQGFGILTRIDVQETLRKKLGVDFPRYLILGACNPGLAHRALSIDPQMGLLLPCNAVVQENEGRVIVSIQDPKAMFRLTGDTRLEAIATEARIRLDCVLEALA